jgi:hypothetical protein
LLTADLLRERYTYDERTGLFLYRHKVCAQTVIGSAAGTISKRGYVYVRVRSTRWMAHRLAWLYVTGEHPDGTVDHRNCIRFDNRWSNLRIATGAENMQNIRHARRDNTTGYLGVFIDRNKRKYGASITVNGKRQLLGLFDDPELAHAAYVTAKRELHPFGTI